MQVLAEACGAEITERLMLPTILTMGTDLVANVRFNVAKTLTILGPNLSPSVMTSQVRMLDHKTKIKNIFGFILSAVSSIRYTVITMSHILQVKPTLAKLNEDTDFDVRYFASEAAVGMYQRNYYFNIPAS